MRRLISIFGATALVATACSGTTNPPAASTAASATVAATQAPVPGGRLVIAQVGDPKTFQPVISTDTTSSAAWDKLYFGLTRANKDTGETEGQLAKDAPTLSADGLTLTYTLRDNLKWSDGTPFTGDDYKYTVEAVARSPKTVRKSTIQDIVGYADYKDGKTDSMAGVVVSADGKTITVKLTKVFCPGIAGLGGAGAGGILPSTAFKKVWDNKTTDITKNIDDNALNNAPPSSMGPWIWVATTPGTQIQYKANPNFFRGKPYIDELIIKNYADTSAIKAALLTGEVSYASVQAADYEEVNKADILKGYRFPGYGYTYIGWNAKAAKAPWLASRDVRQALWYGINVDAIYQKIVFGLAAKQFGHLPKPSWAYPGDDQFNKYPYDVAKAKSLIEKAGAKMGADGYYTWTDGKPISMRIETNSGNTTRETILQIAVEQYKQIGVKIEPVLEAFNVLLDRTDPGTDYEGFIIGWSLGLDPDSYSIWHSSQQGKGQFNNIGYNNAAVDAALIAGRNGPDCSKAARQKAYNTIDKELNTDAPYTFLYNQDVLLFMNKKLQNVAPTTISTIHNVEQWWVKN
jgi:peptide/nickel transport system substrate-binding protein